MDLIVEFFGSSFSSASSFKPFGMLACSQSFIVDGSRIVGSSIVNGGWIIVVGLFFAEFVVEQL